MKRTAVWMMALLMLFIGIPCAAAGGFYCEYTPKTERSTVFYLDIGSDTEVSAAVMELRFDAGLAEYREVSAVNQTTTVRSVSENGLVKLAFADSGAIKGKLCRVAFKALQTGTCTFRLHPVQAADGEAKPIGNLSDASVEVKLGKDDVVAEASSKSSSKASSGAQGASGSRSKLKEAPEQDERIDPVTGEIIDLRKNDSLKFILIGAGIMVLIAALVFGGVILGRKSAEKQKQQPKKESDNSDAAEEMEDIEPDDSEIADEPEELEPESSS